MQAGCFVLHLSKNRTYGALTQNSYNSVLSQNRLPAFYQEHSTYSVNFLTNPLPDPPEHVSDHFIPAVLVKNLMEQVSIDLHL